MTTRQRVLDLLRGPTAGRIRFTFPFFAGTVTISPVSFRHVANAIERGHVRLDVTNAFPAGVAGRMSRARPTRCASSPSSGASRRGWCCMNARMRCST